MDIALFVTVIVGTVVFIWFFLKDPPPDRKWVATYFAIVVFICFAGIVADFMATWKQELSARTNVKTGFLDSLSFIEHKKNMVVSNAGHWLGGEYRLCDTDASNDPPLLKCSYGGDQLEVRMDVVFDGSMNSDNWDCKYRQDDIFCIPKK
jgi:hypothetical protein